MSRPFDGIDRSTAPALLSAAIPRPIEIEDFKHAVRTMLAANPDRHLAEAVREHDHIRSLTLRASLTFPRNWRGRLAFAIWIAAAYTLCKMRPHTIRHTLEWLLDRRHRDL